MTETAKKKTGSGKDPKRFTAVGTDGARMPSLLLSGTRGAYSAIGYRSVSVASKQGRTHVGASAEYHQRYDRKRLNNQARDFKKDNGIFHGMIERAVAYIIGPGFGLQARTKSEPWNKKAEALWKEEWRRPEHKSIMSGRRVERMMARELLTVGDTAALLLNTGRLQLIEAEQIAHRSFLDGISKQADGSPSKIWVCPYGRGGQVDTSKAVGHKPGEEILFLTDPERPSGIRGVPPCQSTFPMLHRINDVCDSEAIAWQILARLAISITREAGAEIGRKESRADPTKSGGDKEGDFATRIQELDYALIFHGQPGDKVEGIERNIPAQNFPEAIRMFLRLLGLPLGLPLEIVLLDWSKANYSVSRAVLEQAFQTFLSWQELLGEFFHAEVYRWKVERWVAAGYLKARQDQNEHEWIFPTFPWIDQLKEAQAQGARLDRGLTTHARALKSLNLDKRTVDDTREAEFIDAIERAQRIEKKTGVLVPWQTFAGLEIPGRATTDHAKASLGYKREKTPPPAPPVEPDKDEDDEEEDEGED